jgi:hypothetical protein
MRALNLTLIKSDPPSISSRSAAVVWRFSLTDAAAKEILIDAGTAFEKYAWLRETKVYIFIPNLLVQACTNAVRQEYFVASFHDPEFGIAAWKSQDLRSLIYDQSGSQLADECCTVADRESAETPVAPCSGRRTGHPYCLADRFCL